MSTHEEVIMTVKLWGVNRLYVLIIILNPVHSLFSAFCSKCCLLISLFFLNIQVFIKKECI